VPAALPAIVLAALASCGGESGAPEEVVVYASVDQNVAEPVLERFEEETGIPVRAVYDVEAAKTTGLVNRLLAERDRPQADVWWSGEFAQTVTLAEAGVFVPYDSPSADDLPESLRPADDLWTPFGGRARVFIVNTDRLQPEEYPESIWDMVDPGVDGAEVAIAYPVFGTAATHAAALYAALGEERAREMFRDMAASGVRVVDGNAVVRDLVADGRLAFGLTDTDDACGAIERGAPVALVFPDQGPGEIGTLVVPNTVALVRGGEGEASATALIDYLLRPETTADLVEAGWLHVPLRDVEVTPPCVDASHVRAMDVDLATVAAQVERVKAEMAEIFVR
jgi:iron(III) transport system substrate-binding protein